MQYSSCILVLERIQKKLSIIRIIRIIFFKSRYNFSKDIEDLAKIKFKIIYKNKLTRKDSKVSASILISSLDGLFRVVDDGPEIEKC